MLTITRANSVTVYSRTRLGLELNGPMDSAFTGKTKAGKNCLHAPQRKNRFPDLATMADLRTLIKWTILATKWPVTA